LSTDRPAPIRNNVSTKSDLEIDTIPLLILLGIGKNVFSKIAMINKKINHGILMLFPLPLNQ